MYTDLIKRSRLYLDLKKKFQIEAVPSENPNENNKQSTQSVNEVLSKFSSKSLLLAKHQLIQLIKLLHDQNLTLNTLKNAEPIIPSKQAEKRQQKSKEQAQNIQHLKYKLQMYSNQVKNSSQRIDDLKLKIEVRQEYLRQTKTYKNSRQNIQSKQDYPEEQNIIKQSVSATDLLPKTKQAQNFEAQKYENYLNRETNQVPIIELIKGFQNFNKNEDSLIESFNPQDSIHEQSRRSPLGFKHIVNSKESKSLNKKPHPNDESSSLIDTSSFLANYQQSSGIRNLPKSIKQQILTESQISKEQSINEKRKSIHQLKNSDLSIEKDHHLAVEKSSSRSACSIQSSGKSVEESENSTKNNPKAFTGKGRKYGSRSSKNQSSLQSDHQSLIEFENDTEFEKDQKDPKKYDKKGTFLSVLSKYNSKPLKTTK